MARGKDRPGGVGRRDFIVGAGAFLSGAVTTLAVGTPSAVEGATECRVLLHDAQSCVGCGVCSMMCSLAREAEVGPKLSRSGIVRDPFAYNFRLTVCQQCRAPRCYFACPLPDQARIIDAGTGIVYVDRNACIGCGRCVAACPFDPPGSKLHPVTGAAFNCDRCIDRTEGPVCVEYCTMGALSCVSARPPRRSGGRRGYQQPRRGRSPMP